jgi:hypothetical protein
MPQLAIMLGGAIESLKAVPQTLLGKARHYALSQRKYLDRYLLDCFPPPLGA